MLVLVEIVVKVTVGEMVTGRWAREDLVEVGKH